MKYDLQIPRAERLRLQEHGDHYGIVKSVSLWLHRLADHAGNEHSSWDELERWLERMEEDGEYFGVELQPRETLLQKVRDLFYFIRNFSPPRQVRVVSRLFLLLDGAAGEETIQAVLEVDHAKKKLIVIKLIGLPGPPKQKR